MGFSVEYSGLLVTQVLYNTAFILTAVRSLLCWALGSIGLPSPSDEPFHDDDEILHWQDQSAVLNPPATPPSSSPAVSADKIRENLPVVSYGAIAERLTEGSEERSCTKTCAVCLNEFRGDDKIRELRICCHIFHKKCLDGWLDHDQKTCPLCRKPLLVPGGSSSPEPSWAVERLLYLFGDDLLFS